MTKISLEVLHQQFRYDPTTGIFTSVTGKIIGRRDRKGYLIADVKFEGKYNTYKVHRLAWFYTYGAWPEMDLDHKNQVKSDNRLDNLQLSTKSKNMQNTGIMANNRSGAKGVFYRKRRNTWEAYISLEKKTHWLGNFKTKEEAIFARETAQTRIWAEPCTAPKTQESGRDR